MDWLTRVQFRTDQKFLLCPCGHVGSLCHAVSTQLLLRTLSPTAKRPRREANHSHPSTATSKLPITPLKHQKHLYLASCDIYVSEHTIINVCPRNARDKQSEINT